MSRIIEFGTMLKRHPLDSAYALWLGWQDLVTVGLVAIVLVTHRLIPLARTNGVVFEDFLKYYVLGKVANSPDPSLLYDTQAQAHFMRELLGPNLVTPGTFGEYTPTMVPFLKALAVLSPDNAFVCWALTATAISVAGLLLLTRTSQYLLPTYRFILFGAAVLASAPVFRAVTLGQASGYVLGLCALFCWAFLTKRDFIAGIFLAGSAFKPQFAVYFGLPALAQKRWKIVATAVIGEIILFVIAAQIVTWRTALSYPSVISHIDLLQDRGAIPALELSNLYGLLCIWLDPKVTTMITVPVMVACMGWLLWMWHKLDAKDEQMTRYLLALTVLLSLPSGVHTYKYDYVLIAVSAALTLSTISVQNAVKLQPVSLRLWTVGLMLFPLASWCTFWFPGGGGIAIAIPFTAMATLLAVACYLHIRTLRRASHDLQTETAIEA